VRVKLEVPLVAELLSAGVTVMATPLAGVAELTVRTYVVGGGGVVDPPPPPLPQAVSARLKPVAIHTAALQPNCFMTHLPICAAVFSLPRQRRQQGPLTELSEMTGSFYAAKASVVSVIIWATGVDALVVCWG